MAAAAAVAGGEESNGGKRWQVGFGSQALGPWFCFCFWLQKILGSFMLIIVPLFLRKMDSS